MLDALEELSDLYLALQKSDMTIIVHEAFQIENETETETSYRRDWRDETETLQEGLETFTLTCRRSCYNNNKSIV